MNNTDAVSCYWFAQYNTLYLVWSVSRSIQWSKGLWASTGETTLLDNTMTFISPYITGSNRKTMGMILYTVTSGKHVFVTSDNLYAAHLYHDDVIKWKKNRVTGLLCGDFTGHRWIPITKASFSELWYFLWSARLNTRWSKQFWDAGDLRQHRAQYSVTVILRSTCWDLLIYGQAIL